MDDKITINGVLYAPVHKPNGDYMIVRSHSAGVFAGFLKAKFEDATKSTTVIMKSCRRLWEWAGAASLSQLSQHGVSKPSECKFSVETHNHCIMGVIEIIPCADKAIKSINEVPEWTA